MVVTLSSSTAYQVIRTNMIPSYRTINRITQLIVYSWNNSVVIILVRIDGHGHANIMVICCTKIGTVHTPYPWQGNSYSNCNNRERRGRNSDIIIICMRPIKNYVPVPYIHAMPYPWCSGIIIILMVPIGQYIIYRTQYTIRLPYSRSQYCMSGVILSSKDNDYTIIHSSSSFISKGVDC